MRANAYKELSVIAVIAVLALAARFFLPGNAATLPTPDPVRVVTDDGLKPSPAPEAVPAPVPPISVRVPVLVYHNIRTRDAAKPASKRPYDVTPAEFEAQMAYLASHGYRSVSFAELDAALDGRAALPEKPVLITLDDGTLPHFETAFPILQKHGLTATFFVFTHAMGKNPNYMDWDQLRELRDAGMEVQAHTYLHAYLTRADDETLKSELERSRTDLLEKLGIDSVSMAYPFGLRDGRVDAATKAAGYRLARSLRRTHEFGPADRFDIPGYIVTGDFRLFPTLLGE